MSRGIRTAAVAAVLGVSASLGFAQPIAYADRPPAVDPGRLPSGDPAKPSEPTERKANAPCTSTVAGGEGPTVPAAQAALDLPHAWQFSKGEGQVVAVIDTGVARHPRLPGLRAGGDFVSNSGDGTEDCDAHGTLVAGIIAASQVPGQGFSGVAPASTILAIRQTSDKYVKAGSNATKSPEDLSREGYGNVATMAQAIRRAADMGATVINISEVACSSSPISDGSLGAALHYAVHTKNAVVVTSAGNTDNDNCKGNTNILDPLDPAADPWSKTTVNVTPARYDDLVLSVGSINADGAPSEFTVPGPWLSVAAPGENVVSLDAVGTGVINGTVGAQGQQSINGTSFAAPYVSGVVALVRSRFPELSAVDVMKRIQATAHAPAEGWNPYVGYGAVDPVAALTNEVTGELRPKEPNPPMSKQLAVPAPPDPPDHTARNVALIGSGIIGGSLIIGYLASFPTRRRFGVGEDDA
ncbi:type VII secretion-associated serine protease mycosin [Nocardia carnea]|uniref:type VII secretion-associated serine protease mycosin n=1 Tax=Nocardia carnea TaxID=37328 RepID=UPI0024559DEA|nr:type VII secretion-associated serine protease mycosin [Nocardia carnea]